MDARPQSLRDREHLTVRALPTELEPIARTQSGALTHRQLTACGWRKRDVDRYIKAGLWQRVSSRVIATYATPLQRPTALWAAAIHHDRVGLTGAAALECEGLEAARDGRIDLLGPRGTRLAPFDGCQITLAPAPEFRVTTGPPRTSVAESVARASGKARSDRQATFFIIWAIQRRLVTIDEIHAAVERLPRSPAMVAALRALRLVDPGVHSMHEFDFARECRRRGLPTPQRQVRHVDSRGNSRYTDVEFRVGARVLVVEIDGVGHTNPEVRADDEWKENELRLQGAVVLRINGLTLRRDPNPFFEQLMRALQALKRGAM